jgi:hypothetical protein
MLQQIEAARARVRELEETSDAAAREAVETRAIIIAAANVAIDEVIRASGLTYGEILGMRPESVILAQPESPSSQQRPTRKRSGSGGEHPRYALIGDPGCTYSRGPLPLWMKREMEQAGLDAASKADRETFRQTRMVQA